MFEKKGSTGSSGKAYRFVGLRSITVNLFLLLILIIIFIVAVLIGPVYINPVTGVYIVASGVLEWIGSLIAGFSGANIAFFWSIQHSWPSMYEILIWDGRFPRAIAVILVGSGLAVSGAVFQETFRNPLVSDSILGVSTGAGAGATIAILLSMNGYIVQIFAFAGGMLAVGMTYVLSRTSRGNPTLMLVMSGIIVGSLFGSMTSMLKYIADPTTKLPDITFWLMGSFGNVVSMDQVYLIITDHFDQHGDPVRYPLAS